MAGLIRQEDVDAVRERTDIVQVISQHLQLRKAGRDSMVGLCPFHAEKTPSLSVSPSKQVYYCFGCGEGGNVFKFLQKVENLSFVETVERLAGPAGITLRYEGQSPADRRAAGHRQALHRAISDAGGHFRRMLVEGREASEARAYLEARGITADSVQKFALGYAPGYPDFLLKRMSRIFSPELLVEAGLVAKDAGGALRDRFRGRVMFPIHDLSGNAVGFGGRLLAGPNAPPNTAKYVNSPETSLYHKGNLLYNLNRAKAEITRLGRAFLVEGYTDVIALDQAGIHTAVATCGTALGEEHVRLLSRFGDKIVLAFDSDEAGARAAERAFQFFEDHPVELAVLVLPEGKDPADFVLGLGAEASEQLTELAERATPLLEFMIDRMLRGRDLASPEGQMRAVRDVIDQILKRIRDPVLREKYAVLTADKVGRTTVSENAVLFELHALVGAGTQPEEAQRVARVPPSQKVEREVLKLLIQAPELCAGRLPQLTPEHFATAGYRSCFELIRSGAGAGPAALVEMAQARSRGEQIGKLLAALAVEPLTTVGDVTSEYVGQVFLRLDEFALKRQAEDIRKRLERLNPLKSSEEYDALYEQFVRLEGARRRLRATGANGGTSPLA
ncbi:MAG TPA: DNA primase [Actinomycetota bacterium]|jgi:DNA primase